jgi:hypothetical protein
MPALAPFFHLDALAGVLDRAAGRPAAESAGIGPSLFPEPQVTAGTLIWPWEHAHRVVHEWARWTRGLPHDVTSVARLVRLPYLPSVPLGLRGRAIVAIEVAIPREPWVAAGRLTALRALEPEIDTVDVIRPDELHPLHTTADVPAPAVGGHMALDGIPGAAVDAFVALAGPGSGSNLLSAALRQFGPAYDMAAAGVARDADEYARLEIRLALLEGRLAPFAGGRGLPAQPVAELSPN